MYKIEYRMNAGKMAFKMAINLVLDMIIYSDAADQKKGRMIIPITIFSNIEYCSCSEIIIIRK